MHKECISLLSKCGPSGAPPSLPPRPASMLVPSATLHDRLSSTLSLLEPEQASPGTGGHEYVNTRMEEHPWFVGDMDRDQANESMKLYPIGTFLVRARLLAGERVGYALSLRTKEVKTKCMNCHYLNSISPGHQTYEDKQRGTSGLGNKILSQRVTRI